jgi:hypothetical protein
MTSECAFEPNVLRAASRGDWSESLRAHVASCADCAAATEVASWMEQFSVVDERPRALPDPAVLWLKAKLLATNTDLERAARPITRVQMAAYAVVAACWAALLTWKWSALTAWAEAFTPRAVALGASGAHISAPPGTLLLVVAMLASATVAVAMHTILAEE